MNDATMKKQEPSTSVQSLEKEPIAETGDIKLSQDLPIVAETVLALVQSNTRAQAAERLKLSEDGLFYRLRTYPQIKKILNDIPQEALARLQALSLKATDVYGEALGQERNKMEAAREVLDRVGLSGDKPTVLQQFNVGGEMSLEFTGK